MNEENPIGYYAVIPATVLFCEKLKANEKLLYAVITVLANKEGYCFASNNYLGKLFSAQPHTISNWISNLNKLNFVFVEIVRNEKNEVIQRRIYPNDVPYTLKMTYPYTTNMTEGMLQKRQYNNNINNKIDRFFNYIVGSEKQNPEKFTVDEEKEFMPILEKVEFNYTEDIIKGFTEENIQKLKLIIYALKRLFISANKPLIYKVKREDLLFVYNKCKEKQIQYEGTEDEVNDFFEYYYISLTRYLEKI